MNTKITTHDHAPAPYHTLDQLALSRAADCEDTDNPTQSWRTAELNQMRSDYDKLSEQLLRAEKQADLDKRKLLGELMTSEYLRKKAEAERAACLLMLGMLMLIAIVAAVGGVA